MQFYVGRQLLGHDPFEVHLEQMIKDLMQEAERWDLEPKPASLLRTSTLNSEEKMYLSIRPRLDVTEYPSKIFGFSLIRQGKTHAASSAL